MKAIMPIGDKELRAILTEMESDCIERKESFNGDAPKKLRQAICAFANDLPNHKAPGYALIGVDDTGRLVGLDVTDELLRQISDIKTDGNILPLPSMTVERRVIDGKSLVLISVMPSEAPPVQYDGRIWIRTGPRRATASKQDELILNEKRRHKDLPFDIHPLSSSELSDLDKHYYESEYLPASIARDVLDANDRTYEQRLSSSKMTVAADETTPTVLGHLVVGVRTRDFIPGAYIQFLKFDGVDLASDITDEMVIDGRLADITRRVDEKMRAHNTVAVNLVAGDKEIRTEAYPITALQQLIRNAILHRTYESTNAPVKINWFSNRVEIWSPGGPFGVVTSATFGQPGYTDYRNPHIAESMKSLGLVQRFGVGIQTARAALLRNGNRPLDFEIAESAINVTIWKKE
jgi:ATP-dependent DNA helicase RecG